MKICTFLKFLIFNYLNDDWPEFVFVREELLRKTLGFFRKPHLYFLLSRARVVWFNVFSSLTHKRFMDISKEFETLLDEKEYTDDNWSQSIEFEF